MKIEDPAVREFVQHARDSIHHLRVIEALHQNPHRAVSIAIPVLTEDFHKMRELVGKIIAKSALQTPASQKTA